ncbi:hypothetical protein SPF06_02480 [Sinomonas sp. JGH33]|uniref:HK97 gp10 family phage protein n=1 Tax=Sinomonas terricola TaxID=3110330 RepID=A0ABU5T1P7_9MICC|nr:HK97 gp10 family phage protein [Sinomonas sp. JGH33]MEA5453579.1 hypothetical protein [Sinomonas sp. JGH33]
MVSFDEAAGEFEERILAAFPAAAAKAAEHLKQVAVDRAPLETGNLRAEAEVIPEENGATVRFPGPYARYQEFGVSKDGSTLHHEVGQSFYLTSSVFSEKQTCIEIVAQELNQATD